jgi:pilus assembly protein CpaB
MNKQTGLFIVISILFGFGAVYIANNWLDNSQQELDEEQVNVVVTTVALPIGTIIDDKHVRLAVFSKSLLPENTLEQLDDVLGKVVKAPLYKGDIVRKERLAVQGDGSYLASLISTNKRAVTIRVNDVNGVAGFILPGNTVDILNTFIQDGKPTTEVILSQVKILAVDQQAATGENKPQLVRAVTVEVSLSQAEILMNARSQGSLQLALRNPIDNEEVLIASNRIVEPAAEPVKQAVVPAEAEPPVKASKSVKTRQKVEVIRGVRQQSLQVDI